MVDVETSGVYPTDRVIEVAAVTLDLDGKVVDRWDMLVYPARDVGPSWLHGITVLVVVPDQHPLRAAQRVPTPMRCVMPRVPC